MEQQLLWFNVLGRVLVAAGQLLQRVPHFISANGSCVFADEVFTPSQQLQQFGGLTAMLVSPVASMQSMLQQGGAAAAAVEAGSAASAATPADLAQLQQQATALQQQLAHTTRDFYLSHQGAEGGAVSAAMQQLLASCQQDGLPQQLHSFGVACCAAFPQRGCCGNPGWTNLDKFTETALASQGCSGCYKAVKFCSPACHKTAWKQGHKAACRVLKQRHAGA